MLNLKTDVRFRCITLNILYSDEDDDDGDGDEGYNYGANDKAVKL